MFDTYIHAGATLGGVGNISSGNEETWDRINGLGTLWGPNSQLKSRQTKNKSALLKRKSGAIFFLLYVEVEEWTSENSKIRLWVLHGDRSWITLAEW